MSFPILSEEVRKQLTLHWWVSKTTTDEGAYTRIQELLRHQHFFWAQKEKDAKGELAPYALRLHVLNREPTQKALLRACANAASQKFEEDSSDTDLHVFAFLFADWDAFDEFIAFKEANEIAFKDAHQVHALPVDHPCWDRAFIASLESDDATLMAGLYTFVNNHAFVEPEALASLSRLAALEKKVQTEPWRAEKEEVAKFQAAQTQAPQTQGPSQSVAPPREASHAVPFFLSLYFQTRSEGKEPDVSNISIPMVPNQAGTGFERVVQETGALAEPKSFVSPDFFLHLIRRPDAHLGLATNNPHLANNHSRLTSVTLFKYDPSTAAARRQFQYGGHVGDYIPYAETDVDRTEELVSPELYPSKGKAVLIRLLPTLTLVAALTWFLHSSASGNALHDTMQVKLDIANQKALYKKEMNEAVALLTHDNVDKFRDVILDDGLIVALASDPTLLVNLQKDMDTYVDHYAQLTEGQGEHKQVLQRQWENHEGRKWLSRLIEEEEKLDILLAPTSEEKAARTAPLSQKESRAEPSKGSLLQSMKAYVKRLASKDVNEWGKEKEEEDSVESRLIGISQWAWKKKEKKDDYGQGQREAVRRMIEVFAELRKIMSAKTVLEFYGMIDPWKLFLEQTVQEEQKEALNLTSFVQPDYFNEDFLNELAEAETKQRNVLVKRMDTSNNYTKLGAGIAVIGATAGSISNAKVTNTPKTPFNDWYLRREDSPPLHKGIWKGRPLLDYWRKNDPKYWNFEVPFQMVVTGIHLVGATRFVPESEKQGPVLNQNRNASGHSPATYVLRMSGYFRKVELYTDSHKDRRFADTRELVIMSATLLLQDPQDLKKALDLRKANRDLIVIQGGS